MSGVVSIRRIEVAPQPEKVSEELAWKKFVVSFIPFVGPGLGCYFLKSLHLKARKVASIDRISILKVAKLYHLLISANTATYGLAFITFSYPMSHWGMFVLGATQVYMSVEQFEFMKKTQAMIDLVVNAEKY